MTTKADLDNSSREVTAAPDDVGEKVGVPQARGRTSWHRPPTTYEQFMEDEGVPIYRAVDGIRDIRELQLSWWQRLDCEGAYVQLRGLGGLQGMAVVGVPPRGHVARERHMYEETFYVVEGDGSTHVWTDDEPDGAEFRWQTGSLFTIPLNSWHELTNSSPDRALLITATNAPPLMHLLRSREFVFDNPWRFSDRLPTGLAAYVQPQEEFTQEPLTRRAFYTAALLPDAADRELPYDGQRGTGYKHVELEMGGNVHNGFIGEYPPLSYGKTHTHRSGPMLICLDGEGYTLTWPDNLGVTPWRDGHGDRVRRIEYRQGGVMSPVPGGEAWFHGHYNALDSPLRMLAHLGSHPKVVPGDPGDLFVDTNALLKDGGGTIAPADEDPEARRIFDESIELARTS